MTGINEEESAFEHLPPAQIIIHQKAPFTDHLLRRLRKAVPRHVDKTEQERIANVEEIHLLRTPRRVRGARKSIPYRTRVPERTFRSEERRVGEVCVRKCKSRWLRDN